MAGSPRGRFFEIANAAWFALALFAGGVLFLTLPKQAVSMAEKRTLAGPPQWTIKALLSGDLARSIDDYYSDHFIFRDTFLAWADDVKTARGGGLAAPDVQVFETPHAAPPAAQAGMPANTSTDNLDEGDYSNIHSVVVYRGHAVQIAMGSDVSAAYFAAMVNDYHRALPGVTVYVMAIPVGSDFYLPHAIDHGEMRELTNIRKLYSDLDPGVIGVDAYGQMAQHTGEYIEYRTDHHWTGLGAYYAYRAFAAAAGLTPLPLTAMTKKTIPNFLGSLYYYTRSQTLKENPDVVDYYVIPLPTQENVYMTPSSRPMAAHVYQETAKGGNAYGVFIGGDHPLTQIISPKSPTLRKIVVIKDSYGNAFVPYLAAHYREVWVVDYRFYKGNIPKLMRDNGIGEILFAHNSYVINGPVSVRQARAMLTTGASLMASAATTHPGHQTAHAN